MTHIQGYSKQALQETTDLGSVTYNGIIISGNNLLVDAGSIVLSTYANATLWLKAGLGGMSNMTGIRFDSSGTNWIISNEEAYHGGLLFRNVSESANRLFLATGGNVGIGTILPSEKLEVVGDILISDPTNENYLYMSGPSAKMIFYYNDADRTFRFYSDNGAHIHFNPGDAGYNTLINPFAFACNTAIYGTDAFNAAIFCNATTNCIGIGTGSPTAKLELSGIDIAQSLNVHTSGAANALVVASGGNVGIGTAAPTYELDVAGNIGLDEYIYHNADADTNIQFTDDDININVGGIEYVSFHQEALKNEMVFNSAGETINFIIEGNTDTALFFLSAGNDRVGISTKTPRIVFDVDGGIASAQTTCTASSDAFDVSDVNSVLMDTTAGTIVIGGFAGGVAGQIIHVAISVWDGNVTMEHMEATGTQKLIMHQELDETMGREPGGWTFICDGTYWYDCSHARHV
jgi:hypothetical protein